MDLPVGGVRKSERPTERLCALWPVSSYGWGVYFCMHIWLQVLICVYASAGACHQAALRHQIWSLQMLTSAACHFIKIDEWRGEKEEKEREKRCRWEKRQSWMAGGNGRGHGGVMEESVNQTTFCMDCGFAALQWELYKCEYLVQKQEPSETGETGRRNSWVDVWQSQSTTLEPKKTRKVQNH